MKSPVWTLEFLNAEKTRQLKGGHWEIVLTYKDADYTVNLYRHAVQVIEMLKSGDIDGAKAFCHGDLVKAGKQHRDTTAAKAEKAAAEVVKQRNYIAELKDKLAAAEKELTALEKAAAEAKAAAEKAAAEKAAAEKAAKEKAAEKAKAKEERETRRKEKDAAALAKALIKAKKSIDGMPPELLAVVAKAAGIDLTALAAAATEKAAEKTE